MAARCRVNGLEGTQPSLLSFLQAMVVTWYQSIPRCFFAGRAMPMKGGGEAVKLPSAWQVSIPGSPAHPVGVLRVGLPCTISQNLAVRCFSWSVPPSRGKRVDGTRWLLKLTSHWPEGAWRGHQHQGPPGAAWDTHWAGPLVMLCVIPLPTQLQSPPGIPMSSTSRPIHHQTV